MHMEDVIVLSEFHQIPKKGGNPGDPFPPGVGLLFTSELEIEGFPRINHLVCLGIQDEVFYTVIVPVIEVVSPLNHWTSETLLITGGEDVKDFYWHNSKLLHLEN